MDAPKKQVSDDSGHLRLPVCSPRVQSLTAQYLIPSSSCSKSISRSRERERACTCESADDPRSRSLTMILAQHFHFAGYRCWEQRTATTHDASRLPVSGTCTVHTSDVASLFILPHPDHTDDSSRLSSHHVHPSPDVSALFLLQRLCRVFASPMCRACSASSPFVPECIGDPSCRFLCPYPVPPRCRHGG